MDLLYGFNSAIADMTTNRSIKIDDRTDANYMTMAVKYLNTSNFLQKNIVLRDKLQKKLNCW